MDDERIDALFDQLNARLDRRVDRQFFKEPQRFKSILEVIDVVGKSPIQLPAGVTDENFSALLRGSSLGYARLLEEQAVVASVIEEVVQLQHGGLNSSIESMGEVISSYKKSQELLSGFRSAYIDIQSVMSPSRPGQSTLRDLYEKKRFLEEQLRMLDDFENLFDASAKIQRLNTQRKFLSAVKLLNASIESMHGEDMLAVRALDGVRSSVLQQKENLIDSIVIQLKDIILSTDEVGRDLDKTDFDDTGSVSEFESDTRSEMTKSIANSELATAGDGFTSKLAEILQSDAWHLDLDEVSEDVEEGAEVLTGSVSVYIRLLIRAANGLSCEMDVQRMVLDLKPESFSVAVNKLLLKIVSRKSPKLDEKIYTKRFNMLMTGVLTSAYLMLKKILYITRLVRISKLPPEEDSKTSLDPSESNKEHLISLWKSIEDAVIDLMCRHFVELDVQEITNEVKVTHTLKKIPKKIVQRDIFSDGYEIIDENETKTQTVCPPTVKLAAGVYNDIAGFTERVLILLREELDPNINPDLVSNILKAEQRVLENELMPVVQSIVNKEIRDMQTNGCQFFSTVSLSNSAELENISKSVVDRIQFDITGEDEVQLPSQGVGQLQPRLIETDADDVRVCLASLSSLKTLRPLLSYWIHLPMHRGYIVTIIERFVFGYVTSARQELDNVTWKLVSVDKKHNSAIKNAVECDPFYTYYRSAVYDGYLTPEEIMSKRTKIKEADFYPTEQTAITALAEFDSWQELWDVSATKYDATNSIILKDLQKVQIIASMAYGTDWLSLKMAKRFVAAVRRLTSAPRPSSVSIFAPRVVKTKTSAAIQEFLSPLRKIFENGIKELSKLSKECISVLRGELQISCFHFLHLISKLDFSNKTTSKDGDGRPEPEALVGAWNQYILAFQDALLISGHSSLIAVVFSPICRLAPRLLIRGVKSLFDSVSSRTLGDGSDCKTKLLRAILACQQGLSMLFESSGLDPIVNRIIQDLLTEEFLKVRRFIQLLGCLISELQTFMASTDQDFTKEELRTLWINARDKDPFRLDFDEYWISINSATISVHIDQTDKTDGNDETESAVEIENALDERALEQGANYTDKNGDDNFM